MKEIKLMGFGEPDENGEQHAKSQKIQSPQLNKPNKSGRSNINQNQKNTSVKKADTILGGTNLSPNQVKPRASKIDISISEMYDKPGSKKTNSNRVNPNRNRINTDRSHVNVNFDPANSKINQTADGRRQVNARPNQPNMRQSQPPTRDEMRQTNGKVHKKRRKKNYILYYIILSFLLTVVTVSLSLTVFFNLGEITVKDYPGIEKEKIIASSALKVGDNLLRMNVKKAEAKILNENIMLDSVRVKRKFPSNVEISLDLSEQKLGIKNGSEYYYFSEAGRFFTKSTQRSGLIFQGVNVSKIILGEYLTKAAADEQETMQMLQEAIKQSGIPHITYVDMREITGIKLYYRDEIEIKIGSISDLEYKLEYAKNIIEQKMEAGAVGQLDVQVQDKGFFRPIDFIAPW